jgi:hypothetical protein
MTSTDTSAPPDLTPILLDLMAEIFIWQYEAVFKIEYEGAVQALGKSAQGKPRRPREPGDEIRNAFDHFALGIRCAFEVDDREVPPVAETITGAPEKPHPDRPKTPTDDAYNNLAQARRHIAVGRFYCIEHQIICSIGKLRRLIASLDDMRRASYAETANSLVADFLGIPRLPAGPQFIPTQIENDIEQFTAQTEKLKVILNKLLHIADELAPPAPAA